MSYMALSVASIMGARRPAPKPFNITNFDESYPNPPSSMPDEISTNRATVGVAAKAISNYIKFMRYDYEDFGNYWKEIRYQVRGGCDCVNDSEFEDVTNLWRNFNKTLELYYEVTLTSFSLVGYFNSANVNQAITLFTAVKNLIDRITSCKECLLTNILNGNTRNFKNFCKGIAQETVSAGVTDAGCIEHGKRAVRRIENIFRRGMILRQKRNERAKRGVESRVTTQVARSYSMMYRGILNYENNITKVVSSKIILIKLF